MNLEGFKVDKNFKDYKQILVISLISNFLNINDDTI